MRRESERRDIFERYIGEIAQACQALAGADAKALYEALLKQAKRRTAVADAVLDDEGHTVKDDEGLDDGVVIVPSEPGAQATGPSPARKRRNSPGAQAIAFSAPGTPSAPPQRKRAKEPEPHVAPPASEITRPPKPRTRLVGGKLVPVEGGLF
jgi:hypothetical protein